MKHNPNNKECAKNKCGTYVNCNNVAEGRICFVGGDTTGNFPITPPIAEEKQKCPSCGKEGSLSLAEAIRINAENGRCFECANSGNASPVEEKCSHGPTIGCPSCPNSTGIGYSTAPVEEKHEEENCGIKALSGFDCPTAPSDTQPTSDWEDLPRKIREVLSHHMNKWKGDLITEMYTFIAKEIAQAKEEGRREGSLEIISELAKKHRDEIMEQARLATITLFEEWCGSNSDRLPDTQTKKGAPIVFVADLLAFAESIKTK